MLKAVFKQEDLIIVATFISFFGGVVLGFPILAGPEYNIADYYGADQPSLFLEIIAKGGLGLMACGFISMLTLCPIAGIANDNAGQKPARQHDGCCHQHSSCCQRH